VEELPDEKIHIAHLETVTDAYFANELDHLLDNYDEAPSTIGEHCYAIRALNIQLLLE